MKAVAAGRQRKLQRNVHLLAGVLLLGYVYAPAPSRVQELVRFLVFPLLVATGVAMWQAPRIRRLRKSAGSRLHTRSRARSLFGRSTADTASTARRAAALSRVSSFEDQAPTPSPLRRQHPPPARA